MGMAASKRRLAPQRQDTSRAASRLKPERR
jgi:hypothetical protein